MGTTEWIFVIILAIICIPELVSIKIELRRIANALECYNDWIIGQGRKDQ